MSWRDTLRRPTRPPAADGALRHPSARLSLLVRLLRHHVDGVRPLNRLGYRVATLAASRSAGGQVQR